MFWKNNTMLIAVAVGVMLVGVAVLSFARDAIAQRKEPIKEYSYSSGGDMRGSHHRLSIKKLDGEKALVFSSDAEWHYMDPVVAEYYVPATTMNEIEKVYDEYKLYQYKNAYKSKFQVLDGATSSYHFTFESKEYKDLGFSSTQNIAKEGYEGLRKIHGIIKAAVAKGERLPGLVLPKLDENKVPERITEGKVTLRVYEYSRNYLCYRLANGTKAEIKGKFNETLYKLNGGQRELLAESNRKYEHTVSADYAHEDSMELKNGRLGAGKYVLSVGGFETEFEIK